MMRTKIRSCTASPASARLCLLLACRSEPQTGEAPATGSDHFAIEEATIAEIHQAMAEGRLTARQLVERYLARIEACDKQGPSLNAIITLNPRALERADELDATFRQSGLSGPLHGIPMIVKDNYDTADLPATAGSLSLQASMPPDGAFRVRKIRQADEANEFDSALMEQRRIDPQLWE